MISNKPARRILVTGGTGFVGRACTAALAGPNTTVATLGRGKKMRRKLTGGGKKDPVHFDLDLFDSSAVKECLAAFKPTDILHCAWDVTPSSYWNSQSNFDWVGPTVNLARELAACGGKRFVGVGSCAEYKWGEPVLSEMSTPCEPGSKYGQAKLKAHLELKKICPELGLNLAWSRLFFLFGPGESTGRLVPDAITSLLRGENFICRAPDAERDIIFIEDAGRAIADLVRSDLSGVVNIGAGRTVSVRSIVESIGAQLKKEELIRFEPVAAGESDRFCAGIGRLISELHFTPAYSLRQGLERSIDWWRSQLGLP